MLKKSCLLVTLILVLIVANSQANIPFTQNRNRYGPSSEDGILGAVLTGEFLVDTIPNYRPRTNNQEMPAVAFDGTNYLVVWQHKTSSQYNIIGCRINQAGVPIDASGFTICSASRDQKYPAVAFDGENYLVVWQDYRSNSNWDIYGCRVTTDGEVLDGSGNSGGIVISNAAGDQTKPAIAFGDTNYFVVWDDQRPGIHDIYGGRVTIDGDILDGTGVQISNNNGTTPAIAFDGTNYLVAWSTSSPDIYCARVNQLAGVLDPAGIAISTLSGSQEYPAVAFDGTNYLVVWKDNRNGGIYGFDIYGSRVSTSGNVVDPSGIPISNVTDEQTDVSLAFGDTNYLVVWQDDRDFVTSNRNIYGCRIDKNGNVLDASGIAISTASDTQQFGAVAFGSTNYFVVWQDRRNYATSKWDIYGGRVGTDGSVIDASGILMSSSANEQWYSASAFDGTNYLVVWMDSRNTYTSGNDIYGIRVNSSGNILDTAIAISAASGSQNIPDVCFDGTNYLVVWEDNRNSGSTGTDIYGARVSPAGVVLDTSGIAISTAADDQNDPSVAFDGTNYLVAWEDNRDNVTTYCDIYGCRVSQDGIPLDPTGIAVTTAVENQYNPCIAFDGTNYLVVWDDIRSSVDYDIYGCRVDTGGTPLEPLGITISTATNNQMDPSVVFDGIKYFVVWSDSRNDIDYDIYGCRVSTVGSPLDPAGIAISIPSQDQLLPDMVFDGVNYVVVWCDYRSGAGYDIYGATVNTSLTVLSTALIVRTQFDDDMYPNLANGNGRQLLLTYYNQAGIVDNKAYNAYRAWAKILGSLPGWVQRQSMPTQITPKYVKDGGSMVAIDDHDFGTALYAFRGYKSNEFYKFTGLWTLLESIPFGVKPDAPTTINKKKISKGASLCWNGDSIIYATKGNNTREFWAYDISTNTWTAKAFIPVPKGLKGGTSIAYKNNKVYLLAGGQKKTDLHNFYIYNPIADTINGIPWDTLAKVSLGLYYKAWKDGSCITVIHDTIYALKGGDKFNYLWAFDLLSSAWVQKETIPLIHPLLNKKNKVGDGGAIATDGSVIYAIKGKGKQDFWRYTPFVNADAGIWTPFETVPFGTLGKKGGPKTGAALAYLEGNVFLLKGNKTSELWQYIPGIDSIAKVYPLNITSVTDVKTVNLIKPTIRIAPNPLTKHAVIYYTVPISGRVTLKLFNATGRLIETFIDEHLNAGSYTLSIDNWKLKIPRGVYFLRYSDATNQSEIKLIVQ